ncbi:PRK06851 family protein [Siminovitchia fortis]|uniref:PRK06851 family protein n=1 Tax=Siminovitchia fortis TaxID=254758 RepID=UPI0011A6E2FC|nr:PRK06851 family protein [Siminovitchia fortis]
MSGNVLHYFGGGNTAKGFSNLYDSNMRGLDRVFILSGKSSLEKKGLIHRLMDEWTGKNVSLEALHSPNDPDSLEGLIIRELGFGIVDGDFPREIGKEFVGDRWETVDLDVMDFSSLEAAVKKDITQLEAKREDALDKAYQSYAAGLRVHDRWEKLYVDRMDFLKADQVTDRLIKKLIFKNSSRKERTTRRRFLGAATPKGPVDFVDNITTGLNKRIFLKGRAGTGKSTVLKKIVMEAEKRGYDLEIYHCGFDPASLDMVVVRELGWAVFDSTQPHEYFPSRKGDEVIDMYELTVAPGTDELYANEIAEIEKEYREQMKAGKDYLAEAKRVNDQLESIYQDNMDHSRIDEIFSDIQKEIKLLAKD